MLSLAKVNQCLLFLEACSLWQVEGRLLVPWQKDRKWVRIDYNLITEGVRRDCSPIANLCVTVLWQQQ